MKKPRKLNVGLVFDDSLDSTDGVSQQVKLLGGWLSGRGHKVSYFVGETGLSTWNGGRVYSLSKNMHVRFNGNRLSMPVWSSRRQIKQALEREQPDVIHVMAPYSPFLAQRIIRLGRQRSVLLGSFHILPIGQLASTGARLLGWVQWRSLKQFDAFSATSPNSTKFAKRYMGISSIVISNSVDVAKFANNSPISKARIVFLGRLVMRKGCRQLIEAFDLLTKTYPEAELVIAGDGAQRPELEKLVKRKGLSSQVKFLGFIAEADKPSLLGSATIACFPSLGGESFGVVLLEAMAAGSGAVLGGNNPGYQTVLAAKPELMFDPKNAHELAHKLEFFLSNKTKREQIHSWQSREIKKYDINVVGRDFERIYYQLIADRRATKA